MAYIKDGQVGGISHNILSDQRKVLVRVVDRPPWRLGAILDFFWAIVNGIAFFFSTMFGDETSKPASGKGGKAWRGGRGGSGGGGWGGGGGGGGRPPPPPGGSGSKPINGLERVRGIDHCASAPGGA